MEVLVRIGGFPEYGSYEGFVGLWGCKSLQKWYGSIMFGIFHVKLHVGVYNIDALEELVAMFHLFVDKDVIHVSKSKPGWNKGRADGFGFKLSHVPVSN